MRLVVVSHKVCWPSTNGTGFSTDGGFPVQIGALSQLFDETRVLVPCNTESPAEGLTDIIGRRLSVRPLPVPAGTGLRRKVNMIGWMVRNWMVIWREVRGADSVHTPIPGDVGTVGMIIAMLQRKPLFVRHCGNWLVQRTVAERMWKLCMEIFAGGRNLMLATGGSEDPPSDRNSNIRWIFSTSLRTDQVAEANPRELPPGGDLRLIIACRQESRKGTDIVIDSMPEILKQFPHASLDVVGDGSLLTKLKEQANALGIAEKVTFHGKVPQEQVLQLLTRAHVFCFPTSASEGFPKAVLEALACGLPVITTRISVLPKLVSSGCGMLLHDATPGSIVSAVAQVCSNDGEYRRMSRLAIATAKEFTLENWSETIGRALRETWKVSHLSSPAQRGL